MTFEPAWTGSGEALFVSPRTVKRHIANAYHKIGAHNRAEATAYALRHGLVERPDSDLS